jgi:hypothetical protein
MSVVLNFSPPRGLSQVQCTCTCTRSTSKICWVLVPHQVSWTPFRWYLVHVPGTVLRTQIKCIVPVLVHVVVLLEYNRYNCTPATLSNLPSGSNCYISHLLYCCTKGGYKYGFSSFCASVLKRRTIVLNFPEFLFDARSTIVLLYCFPESLFERWSSCMYTSYQCTCVVLYSASNAEVQLYSRTVPGRVQFFRVESESILGN